MKIDRDMSFDNGGGETLDFSKALGLYRDIPEGIYEAKIVGVKKKISKAGNDMYVWDIEIDPEDGSGKVRTTVYTVIPDAIFKIREILLAINPDKEDELKGEFIFHPEDYVDCLVRVETGIKEYNNNLSTTVKHFLKSDKTLL